MDGLNNYLIDPDRNNRIIEKHLKLHLNYSTIAYQEKIDPDQVKLVIQQYLEELKENRFATEQGRLAHVWSLKQLLVALEPRILIGDIKAIKTSSEIHHRIAQIEGYYAPVQIISDGKLDITSGGKALAPDQQFNIITETLGLNFALEDIKPGATDLPLDIEEPGTSLLPQKLLSQLPPSQKAIDKIVESKIADAEDGSMTKPDKDYVPLRLRKV